MKNSINKRVAALRSHLSLTQSDFAALIDITPTQLSRIENGKSEPQLGTISQILKATGVSREWLVDGAGELATQNATPSKSASNNYRDLLLEQLQAENVRLQQEALRVWGMVSHLTGGKIPGFLKAIKEAGQPAYHLPGKEFGRSLIAQA